MHERITLLFVVIPHLNRKINQESTAHTWHVWNILAATKYPIHSQYSQISQTSTYPQNISKISQTYQSCTQQNNYIILSCFNEFIKMLQKYSANPTLKQKMKCDARTRAVDIIYLFFWLFRIFCNRKNCKQFLFFFRGPDMLWCFWSKI